MSITLDTDDQAIAHLLDARLADGLSIPKRCGLDGVLLDREEIAGGILRLDLVLLFLGPVGGAGPFQFLVGANDDDFVVGEEPLIAIGNIQAGIAPDDGDDVQPVALPEVDLLEGFPKEAQVRGQLLLDKVQLVEGQSAGDLLLAQCGEVRVGPAEILQETPLDGEGALAQPF